MSKVDEQAMMLGMINDFEEKEKRKYDKNDINNGYIIMAGEKRKIVDVNIDNKFVIKLPNDFELLSEDLMKLKYPSTDRPDLIYSNEYKTTDISFSFEDDGNVNEEIPTVKDEMIKIFKKLYPKSGIIDNETIIINERNLSYFSMNIPLIDTDICNLVFIMKIKSETMIGHFNCKLTEYSDWQAIVKQILESIEIIEA